MNLVGQYCKNALDKTLENGLSIPPNRHATWNFREQGPNSQNGYNKNF